MAKRLFRCRFEFLYQPEDKKAGEWRYYPDNRPINVVSDGDALDAGREALRLTAKRKIEPEYKGIRLHSVEVLSTIDE